MTNYIRLKDLLEVIQDLEISEDAIIRVENTTYSELELDKYDTFSVKDISHIKNKNSSTEYLHIEF